jgi:hypothetical protein
MNLRKLSTVEFRHNLSEVVNDAAFGKKATIIERHGKGVAVLVPMSFVEHVYRIEPGVVLSMSAPAMPESEPIVSETICMEGG